MWNDDWNSSRGFGSRVLVCVPDLWLVCRSRKRPCNFVLHWLVLFANPSGVSRQEIYRRSVLCCAPRPVAWSPWKQTLRAKGEVCTVRLFVAKWARNIKWNETLYMCFLDILGICSRFGVLRRGTRCQAICIVAALGTDSLCIHGVIESLLFRKNMKGIHWTYQHVSLLVISPIWSYFWRTHWCYVQ